MAKTKRVQPLLNLQAGRKGSKWWSSIARRAAELGADWLGAQRRLLLSREQTAEDVEALVEVTVEMELLARRAGVPVADVVKYLQTYRNGLDHRTVRWLTSAATHGPPQDFVQRLIEETEQVAAKVAREDGATTTVSLLARLADHLRVEFAAGAPLPTVEAVARALGCSVRQLQRLHARQLITEHWAKDPPKGDNPRPTHHRRSDEIDAERARENDSRPRRRVGGGA